MLNIITNINKKGKRGDKNMKTGWLLIIFGGFLIVFGIFMYIISNFSYVWYGAWLGGVIMIFYGIQNLQRFSIYRGKIKIKCEKCGNTIIIPKNLKGKVTLCPECNPDIKIKENKEETFQVGSLNEVFEDLFGNEKLSEEKGAGNNSQENQHKESKD